MSTKAQVQTQAKTPAAPTAARIPQPRVAELEREADRPDIATQLEGAARLGHSLGAISVRSAAPSQIQAKPLLQRQELPEEEEEEELQMKPDTATLQRKGRGEGFRLDDDTASRINRARGGGKPLDGAIQAQMAETMGHDFSGVRVHTDAEADTLNQQLSAKAFTTGRDIFFRRSAYEPGSSSSRELIKHELTHVVQQSSGRVLANGSGLIVRSAGDGFEQEADRFADAVAPQGEETDAVAIKAERGGRLPENDVRTIQRAQYCNQCKESYEDAQITQYMGKSYCPSGHLITSTKSSEMERFKALPVEQYDTIVGCQGHGVFVTDQKQEKDITVPQGMTVYFQVSDKQPLPSRTEWGYVEAVESGNSVKNYRLYPATPSDVFPGLSKHPKAKVPPLNVQVRGKAWTNYETLGEIIEKNKPSTDKKVAILWGACRDHCTESDISKNAKSVESAVKGN